MKEIGEDFEKYLTKEEEEEIARGLSRGEEDFKNGRIFDHEEFKRIIGRLKEQYCKWENTNWDMQTILEKNFMKY